MTITALALAALTATVPAEARPFRDAAAVAAGMHRGVNVLGYDPVAGYAKPMLAPGAGQAVTLIIDPRLLATWDQSRHGWHVASGRYRVTLAGSAADPGSTVTVALPERWVPAG